jgi:catechol 2,3-dioxygenase-like lactoylglutathione lyase family enzyme
LRDRVLSGREFAVPARAVHHIDLAVEDVERSLAFYTGLLGPLGVEITDRFPTYRGTEEVAYLTIGEQALGFRKADKGTHRYYDVGIEHFAITVDTRQELDQAFQRCIELGARVQYPPQEDCDIPGYWAFFVFDPDGFRLEILWWPGEHGATS